MKYMKKLHSRREPAGLEWTILKKLPMILLGGTFVPLMISGISRLFPPDRAAALVAKHIQMMDILAIALGITAWTAVFTVAIGCVVVVLMKGPAYVADAYDLVDADRPAPFKRDK